VVRAANLPERLAHGVAPRVVSLVMSALDVDVAQRPADWVRSHDH
jgi:hypothetical protein